MNYEKNAESRMGILTFLSSFSELKLKKAFIYIKQIANFSKSLKFKHKNFFV